MRVLAIVLGVTLALVGCAALVNHISAPVKLEGVAQSIDSAIDAAILGHSRASAKSSALARSEPHIETALDVVSKPHYAQDVSRWAAERQLREAEKVTPHPAKSISSLEQEQRRLRAQLNSMMKHRVQSTTSQVDSVLQKQERIGEKNNAQIRRDLSTDQFDPAAAPAFHSAALDKRVRVVNAGGEVQSLERELARKIRQGGEMVQQNKAKSPVVPAPVAREGLKAKVAAALRKFSPQTASLAEEAVAAAQAATPSAPAASSAPQAAEAAGESEDDTTPYAWDSPPYKRDVPVAAVEDDGFPAAHRALQTARDRVNARLSAQLRNAKARLERFRSHWSVHMPEELRKATNEGWSSQYSKDYMNEGKTRSDLATEAAVIDSLQKDMQDKYDEEEDAATKLRDVQAQQLSLSAKVAALDQQIDKDQRDLSVAQANQAALRKHLPESYDDLSDDDYESYKPNTQ